MAIYSVLCGPLWPISRLVYKVLYFTLNRIIQLSLLLRMPLGYEPRLVTNLLCQGWVPAYLSLGTRGVVSDGWLGVRGSFGAWEGLRLGERWL